MDTQTLNMSNDMDGPLIYSGGRAFKAAEQVARLKEYMRSLAGLLPSLPSGWLDGLLAIARAGHRLRSDIDSERKELKRLALEVVRSEKRMEYEQFPDLAVDIGKRQEYNRLPQTDILEHLDPKQRHDERSPYYIGESCFESLPLAADSWRDTNTWVEDFPDRIPHDADTFSDTDTRGEDTQLSATDMFADTEERFEEAERCASLRHHVPKPDLSRVEGVRAQILANTSMILYLRSKEKRVPDLLTVKLRDGRYMAVIGLRNTDEDWPVARLVKSKPNISLMEAYEELLELVSEDLYAELQWKVR